MERYGNCSILKPWSRRFSQFSRSRTRNVATVKKSSTSGRSQASTSRGSEYVGRLRGCRLRYKTFGLHTYCTIPSYILYDTLIHTVRRIHTHWTRYSYTLDDVLIHFVRPVRVFYAIRSTRTDHTQHRVTRFNSFVDDLSITVS